MHARQAGGAVTRLLLLLGLAVSAAAQCVWVPNPFTGFLDCKGSGSGGSGTVTLVSGTANQITVTSPTTTPVLSIPTDPIFPGNATAGNLKRGSGSPEGVVTGSIGDVYQRTDLAGFWTKQTGTANTTGWIPAELARGQVFVTSATRLTITPFSCYAGNVVGASTSNATFDLNASVGSSRVLIWCTDQGVRIGQAGALGTCNGQCTAEVGTFTDFPAGVTRIAQVDYTSNVFGTPVDMRVLNGAQKIEPGTDGNVDVSAGSNGAALIGLAADVDLSGKTAFRVPVAAGATATTNGRLKYDSTNNMLHAAQSSADAYIPQATITPVNNDCAKWVVSGSNYKLGSAGAGCGGGFEVDFPSGSTNQAGTPSVSSGWNLQGSTNLTVSFIAESTPTSIIFSNAGNSSEAWKWWPVPLGYAGQTVTLRFDAYSSSGVSAGQIGIIYVKTACLSTGGSLLTTTFPGGPVAVSITFVADTGALAYSGTATLPMDSCTAGKVLKMAAYRTPGTGADNAASPIYMYNMHLSY